MLCRPDFSEWFFLSCFFLYYSNWCGLWWVPFQYLWFIFQFLPTKHFASEINQYLLISASHVCHSFLWRWTVSFCSLVLWSGTLKPPSGSDLLHSPSLWSCHLKTDSIFGNIGRIHFFKESSSSYKVDFDKLGCKVNFDKFGCFKYISTL